MLIKLWKHECKCVIADRFTTPADVDWFDKALAKLIEEEFGEEKKSLVDSETDAYFVDFLRDAPEAPGNYRNLMQEEIMGFCDKLPVGGREGKME